MIEPIHPGTFRRAEGVRVFINDTEREVLRTKEAMFVCAPVDAPAVARLEACHDFAGVAILPRRHNIETARAGERAVTFPVTPGQHLLVEMMPEDPRAEKFLPLFFYALPPEKPDTNATHFFKGGQSYEVGELRLRDNESVYIERGAVVRGRIVAEHAQNIRVAGQGILDNSYYADRGRHASSIYLLDCRNATLENFLMVHPTTWMIHLSGCEDVVVRGVREIGECVGSDGLDIVGSRRVRVENCFFRNNDDCVVVKHVSPGRSPEVEKFLKPVSDVLVTGCALWHSIAGNVMEIGHELLCDEVRGITFRDIDVLHTDGGAVFSINAGDQALVRDIVFEDIRVDHYWCPYFVSLRVMKSQFNRSPERGRIENITLRNIAVHKQNCNDGYTVSLVSGWDATHRARGIRFENFTFNGKKVMTDTDLDLHTKYADDITFA